MGRPSWRAARPFLNTRREVPALTSAVPERMAKNFTSSLPVLRCCELPDKILGFPLGCPMTEVLQTLWSLDPFKCVLVATGNRYAVQVLTRTEALLTESARTIEEAHKTAKRLLGILRPDTLVFQRTPPRRLPDVV